MAKVIKSVKTKLENGSYSNPIPFGADASNIDLANGHDLETTLGNIEVDTKGTVQEQIDRNAEALVVTMDTSVTSDGQFKSYTFKQDNQTIGVVDIPKDMVVSKGEVLRISDADATTDRPAGLYIVLTVANKSQDKLYINVGALIDVYTAQQNAAEIQLAVNQSNNEISATIVTGSIAESKLDTALKNKLAKAVSAVQSITIGNENGTINIDGADVKVKGLQSAAYRKVEEIIGWTNF